MTSPLRTLLDRVEQGEGADFRLDCHLAWTFDLEPWAGQPEVNLSFCAPGSKTATATPHFTASIDAAVSLVEKVLPGHGWSVERYGHSTEGTVIQYAKHIDDRDPEWNGTHHTPARALLKALLRAKIAQEERT